MVTTMQAMAAATANSTALPGPSYDLCFPVLEAVLSSSVHTPLHEQALQVMALHVAPGLPLPRKQTLAVLYHVLAVVPAYRLVMQPCTTPSTEECSEETALQRYHMPCERRPHLSWETVALYICHHEYEQCLQSFLPA